MQDRKIRSLERELDEQEKSNKKLKDEITSDKKRIKDLENENSTTKLEITGLNKGDFNLSNKITSLQTEQEEKIKKRDEKIDRLEAKNALQEVEKIVDQQISLEKNKLGSQFVNKLRKPIEILLCTFLKNKLNPTDLLGAFSKELNEQPKSSTSEKDSFTFKSLVKNIPHLKKSTWPNKKEEKELLRVSYDLSSILAFSLEEIICESKESESFSNSQSKQKVRKRSNDDYKEIENKLRKKLVHYMKHDPSYKALLELLIESVKSNDKLRFIVREDKRCNIQNYIISELDIFIQSILKADTMNENVLIEFILEADIMNGNIYSTNELKENFRKASQSIKDYKENLRECLVKQVKIVEKGEKLIKSEKAKPGLEKFKQNYNILIH